MNPPEPDPDFAARLEATGAEIDMLVGHLLSHSGEEIAAAFQIADDPLDVLPAVARFVSYRQT